MPPLNCVAAFPSLWSILPQDLTRNAGVDAQTASLDSTDIESWYSTAWQIPTSVIVIVVLAITAFIIWLYLRERGKSPLPLRVLLIALRMGTIGLLLLMIMGWQRNEAIIDKPDLVILIDTSSSMQTIDEYANVSEASTPGLAQSDRSRLGLAKSVVSRNVLEQLQKKYHVKLYQVDQSLRQVLFEQAKVDANATDSDVDQPQESLLQDLNSLVADGNSSRLGDALIRVIKLQRGRSTSAIVLMSDGINNSGRELSEAADLASRRSIPLYLLGIGSPDPPRDVRLGELMVERKVFVDDAVNLDFTVHSNGYAGSLLKLQLLQGGTSQVLAESELRIVGATDVQPARLSFRPHETGPLALEIRAVPLESEVDLENNQLRETIEVHNETIRVLLVADYPNREFHFLKQLLTRSVDRNSSQPARAIELKTLLQQGDLKYASTDSTALRVFPVRSDELFQFDVVILCDCRIGDTAGSGALGNRDLQSLYQFVATHGKGLVVVAGHDNSLRDFIGTPAETLLPFDANSVEVPDANADLLRSFPIDLTQAGSAWSPFQISDLGQQNAEVWSLLPGFFWMAETPVLRPGTRILAAHATKTGNDGQRLAVVAMHYVGAGKVVFHASPETYRWRYRIGDRYFGRYWGQLIRYLSRSKLNQENQSIRLFADRDQYQAGDDVVLSVLFADDRQAPVADDSVKVVLQKTGVARESIVLQRTNTQRGTFAATVSQLAPGDYQAWLVEPVPTESSRIDFHIAPPLNESAKLQMNMSGLQSAAVLSQGKMYTVDQADTLFQELPEGRPVTLSSLPPEPLWQKWFVVVPFALLLTLLLTAEWMIRKWNWML
jgi:hypothetical protein